MNVKKKGLCLLAASAAFMAMLAGCGTKTADNGQAGTDDGQAQTTTEEDADAAGEDKNVSLRFWCDPEELELFQEQMDTFVSEHKNEAKITIECEPVAASECKDVLLDDVNHGADVFCIPDDQVLAMTAAGVLEEVTNADAIAAQHLEGAVDGASVNGKLFAYPLTADNGYFLFYDQRYFQPDDVKTMDRILEICEKEGKKFAMDWSSGWYLYSFFGNTGLTLELNEDGLTNFCDWNKAEGEITGLDVAKGMLSISASPAFISEPDIPAAVAKGNVIAAVSGVWGTQVIKQAFGGTYGACKLPTYTCGSKQVQMASFTGYRLLGVNAYSEHKAWAEKLAEYLSGEESQTLRFERAERGPSNKNAAASDEVKKNPAILAVLEQSEFGVLQKVGQRYWEPVTSFGNTMAAGNPGDLPLQDLLDQMVSKITE